MGLAIVAEPYRFSGDNPNWVGNNSGSAAIVRAVVDLSPLQTIERGEGYVAAKWGSYHIVSCYAPPDEISVSITHS